MIDADSKIISDIIGSIYESVYKPGRLNAVVAGLQTMFHGSRVCFQRYGRDVGPSDTVATDLDPVFIRRIPEHIEPSNVLINAMAAAPIGIAYVDETLVDSEKLQRSRFWNEWMAPQDMYSGMGCKLLELGDSFWFLDIRRGRNQRSFESSDIALLDIIAPHLARATQISKRFQSTQLTASTFSHLPFGVIIVDGNMRIASVNAAAEAVLLRPGCGLLRKSGYLAAADVATMTVLRRLIIRACKLHHEILPAIGGDMIVRKLQNSDGSDVTVSVETLVNPFQELPLVGPHAAIFIREITLDLPKEFADHIRALFGLTPKEAGLAALLVSGRTLKESAEDSGIRFSTARSYLDNIFLKTGTRQQSQLVALLKSAQPMMRSHRQ
ncbi:MAG TPA: LuxR family transcriptional regulator [Afipia sp.]